MSFSKIVVFVMAFGFLGCAEQADRAGTTGWTKVNGTIQEYQRVTDECRGASTVAPVALPSAANVAAQRSRRYIDCMNSQGWTIETVPSGQATPIDESKLIVACLLPSERVADTMTMKECRNRFGKIL